MKSLAYREAGKAVRAKYAERKARHWLRKAMLLEGRTVIGKPQSGRRAPD